jgi:heme-degrading monooxygenase HmoA
MIARHWTGVTQKEKATEYIQHLQNVTFPKIKTIPGFIAAKILHRESKDGTEFVVITEWESIEAIKQFAGQDCSIAVVPQLVQEIMIRFDKEVKHYEVLV